MIVLVEARTIASKPGEPLGGGEPRDVPAANTVEFVPEGTLTEAAKSETAQPAETVPEFKYIPLPGQTPSNKVTRTRTLPMRSK